MIHSKSIRLVGKEESSFQRFLRETKEEGIALNRVPIFIKNIVDYDYQQNNGNIDFKEGSGKSNEEVCNSKVIFFKKSTVDRINEFYRNILNTEYRFDRFTPKKLDTLQRQLHWSEDERLQIDANQLYHLQNDPNNDNIIDII